MVMEAAAAAAQPRRPSQRQHDILCPDCGHWLFTVYISRGYELPDGMLQVRSKCRHCRTNPTLPVPRRAARVASGENLAHNRP